MGNSAPKTLTWPLGRAPKTGDRFVLVDDTKFWEEDQNHRTPAFVSVAEVLGDLDFVAFNQTIAHVEIQESWQQLSNVNPALIQVLVPVLLVGGSTTNGPHSALAYTPNLANFQWGMATNSNALFPRVFGPDRDLNDRDLFERGAAAAIPAIEFVDEWSWYHDSRGEVHCGTAVIRQAPINTWWSAQP